MWNTVERSVPALIARCRVGFIVFFLPGAQSSSSPSYMELFFPPRSRFYVLVSQMDAVNTRYLLQSWAACTSTCTCEDVVHGPSAEGALWIAPEFSPSPFSVYTRNNKVIKTAYWSMKIHSWCSTLQTVATVKKKKKQKKHKSVYYNPKLCFVAAGIPAPTVIMMRGGKKKTKKKKVWLIESREKVWIKVCLEKQQLL